jgi:hypothetical protein
VKDTPEIVARLIAEHHGSSTVEQRFAAASSLFDTARAIVDAPLPAELKGAQRRYAVAKRLYGDELPEAALLAHATQGT